jgi:hypothetical protein
MAKQIPKPEVPRDGSRFALMIERLDSDAAFHRHQREFLFAAEIETAIHWLRNYIDPWLCPDCGHTSKVPDSDHDPRACPRCNGNRMFPYSYLEAERMNKQLTLMLQGLTYYAQKSNGHMAKKILKEISEVRLEGTWKPVSGAGIPEAPVPEPKRVGWFGRIFRRGS